MDVSTLRAREHRSVALGASILLNIVLIAVIAWPDSAPAPESPPPVVQSEPAVPVPLEETGPAPADPAPAPQVAAADTRVTIASVEGSIPQTLKTAAEPYGDFVSATLSRLLVWDLDLRRDLRGGDRIETMWSLGSTDTVVIDAARFASQKHGKTITAYRFQATGDAYPSYWSADGTEVPHRLKNGPLNDYEQVTSLLKDRPTHHGMDFKVEVGTPVLATASGVVTRMNWNWSANGNCVEVRHDDGVLAKYLHLSANTVKEGERVKIGQELGKSGNTGRSTGPHLHYQLNRGQKVVDPIDYHGTTRRTLPDADRAAFDAVVKSANTRLDEAGALAAK